MPHPDESRPTLGYGVDPDPPARRAERWALFTAFLAAVAAVGALVTAASAVVSLAAGAGILAGIYLVVRSIVDPRVGPWPGVGGAALVVAGSAVLWFLKRHDLDV
ncbi:MAG TPA: hypothetical protein VFB66_12225 [Tepidisphaeraceae bacterium]|nr:hypothetical protein [Tepidisphaeraceae bacterium]